MKRSYSSHASASIRALVPTVARWNGFTGAFLNLLVFGLTLFAAVWIVHQTEYSIEYGARFGSIMQGAPHRLYMAPVGIGLAAITLLFLLFANGLLAADRIRRAELMRHVPRRLARRTFSARWSPGRKRIVKTALLLAACQLVLYLLQENAESLTITGTWPGVSVLFAPRHLTVLPLHLLGAMLGSTILWLLAACLKQSQRATRLVELLVTLVTGRRAVACGPRLASRTTASRVHVGVRCPRAPPLSA